MTELTDNMKDICEDCFDTDDDDEDFEYQQPSGWGALLKEIQCEAVIRRGRIVSFADGSITVIGDIESIYDITDSEHGSCPDIDDFITDIEEKGSQVARMAMSNQYTYFNE
jgi:hypothetical protein